MHLLCTGAQAALGMQRLSDRSCPIWETPSLGQTKDITTASAEYTYRKQWPPGLPAQAPRDSGCWLSLDEHLEAKALRTARQNPQVAPGTTPTGK